MGQQLKKKVSARFGWKKIRYPLTISVFIIITILTFFFMSHGITGVESYGYDDYGGMDPYGDGGGGGGGYDGGFDPQSPENPREDMMTDIDSQRSGYPNELSTRTKKFKLFEKRRLTHQKAKAFCKKREGQLAQAMNMDEMQRLQTLLMKGVSISSNVWIGADKREWRKHSSKMIGMRPNLGPNAMLMGGGGPTAMCPAMSISTRSLAPVECFKEFPFICEFPPGKGKAPPKIKKKTTRKDEMRRKREVIELSSEKNSPTSPYSLISSSTDEVYEKDTSVIAVAQDNMMTEKKDQVGFMETELPQIDRYEENHNIGFHPHIVHESTNANLTQIDRVEDMRELPTIESISSITTMKEIIVSSMSSESTLGKVGESTDEASVTDEPTTQNGVSVKINPLNNEFGTEDLNEEVGSTVHPDQQMVNLYEEQLKNMRLIESEESLPDDFEMKAGFKFDFNKTHRKGKSDSSTSGMHFGSTDVPYNESSEMATHDTADRKAPPLTDDIVTDGNGDQIQSAGTQSNSYGVPMATPSAHLNENGSDVATATNEKKITGSSQGQIRSRTMERNEISSSASSFLALRQIIRTNSSFRATNPLKNNSFEGFYNSEEQNLEIKFDGLPIHNQLVVA